MSRQRLWERDSGPRQLRWRRRASGFYVSEDGRFELHRVDPDRGRSAWYWRDNDTGEGGDDWYPTKQEAILALLEFVA